VTSSPTYYTNPSPNSRLFDVRDSVDYIPVTSGGLPPGRPDKALEAPHARLDTRPPTGANRSQGFKKDLTVATLVHARERTARRERHQHVYKLRLIERLREMALSENLEYQQHAEKWLPEMAACPGRAAHCGEHGDHGPDCRGDHYTHKLCRHPLCAHSQAARSANWGKAFSVVWDRGYVPRPVFNTFNPPNLDHLTNRAIGDLRKVLRRLLKLKVCEPVAGAITGIEVNHNPNAEQPWNLHAHMLADSGYIAHYPMSDLSVRELPAFERSPGPVVRTWGNRTDGALRPFESYRRSRSRGHIGVRKRHAGFIWEFTRLCQDYETLKSPRPDFDLNNPDHWYFMDQRRADRGSVIEVTKYTTKSSTILGSADALMTYVRAIAGNRMLAVHGTFYNHFEIKGREARVHLINMCDAPVTNKNGVERKCGVKNDIRAAACKSCGGALTLSPELADALYAPEDPDGDDPPPDYSPLIESREKVSRRYDCPIPDCPKPSGQKTYLDVGPPRVVLKGAFRLVANLETGNSQIVRG